jgi:hypothetical protein
MVVGTHSILAFFDVNGLATDASASDSEMPELAFEYIVIRTNV